MIKSVRARFNQGVRAIGEAVGEKIDKLPGNLRGSVTDALASVDIVLPKVNKATTAPVPADMHMEQVTGAQLEPSTAASGENRHRRSGGISWRVGS